MSPLSTIEHIEQAYQEGKRQIRFSAGVPSEQVLEWCDANVHDMVLTVEDMHLLVANRIIKLAIDDIQQTDNLRETITDILHYAHIGFVCPNDNEHNLALVVGAQDKRTQLSLVRVLIIKGDTQ